MAGGDTNNLTAPFPKGEDACYILRLGPYTLTGVTGAQLLATHTMDFAAECLSGEWTAYSATDADSDSTFTIEDDTSGTSKKWAAAQSIGGSMATSVVRTLTITKNVTFNAGALLKLTWTPGDAGDALNNACFTLRLKPKF